MSNLLGIVIRDVKKTKMVAPVAEVSADIGAIIPTVKGRKIAYAVYALCSLVITNAAIGFSATQVTFPAWLIVSLAIIGNLSTPFAAIAIDNAKAPVQ